MYGRRTLNLHRNRCRSRKSGKAVPFLGFLGFVVQGMHLGWVARGVCGAKLPEKLEKVLLFGTGTRLQKVSAEDLGNEGSRQQAAGAVRGFDGGTEQELALQCQALGQLLASAAKHDFYSLPQRAGLCFFPLPAVSSLRVAFARHPWLLRGNNLQGGGAGAGGAACCGSRQRGCSAPRVPRR